MGFAVIVALLTLVNSSPDAKNKALCTAINESAKCQDAGCQWDEDAADEEPECTPKKNAKPVATPAVAAPVAGHATPVAGHATPVAGHSEPPGDPMPELPAVSQMLNASGKTITRIADQVNGLKERLSNLAKSEETKLDEAKQKYEEELRTQEIETRRIEAFNAKAAENNRALKTGNDDMRKKALAVQGTNKQLRQELRLLREKLNVATAYIDKSMRKTDDASAREFPILNTEKVSDESDDEDDDADEEEDVAEPAKAPKRLLQRGAGDERTEGVKHKKKNIKLMQTGHQDVKASFLAVQSVHGVKKHKEKHEDEDDDEGDDKKTNADGDSVSMIHNLQAYLTKLSKEDTRSMQQLEKMFRQKWWDGKKKRSAATLTQRNMKIETKKLQTERTSLQKASRHLEKTKDALESSLKSLGSFFRVMSHFASAPSEEAATMMDNLPKTVSTEEI